MADTPDVPEDDDTSPDHSDEQPEDAAAPEGVPPPPRQPLDLNFRVDQSVLRGMRDAIDAMNLVPLDQIRRQLAAAAAVPLERLQREVAAIGSQSLQGLQEQIAVMPRIYDMDKIREQIASAIPKIDLSGLIAALERAREALPPNWEGLTHYKQLGQIAKDDGIPVVWVPRSSVLADLVAAPDRGERVKVLLARQVEIAEDCRNVLSEVTDPDLVVRVPQALEAVQAFEAGLPQAAQTLAVAVSESLLTQHIANGRSYKDLSVDVAVETEDLSVIEVRSTFALLPVHRFYTPWWPNAGTPVPGELSRHVTVHHARADHLTTENAMIAIMLLSSLLRDLQAVRNP